MEQIVNSLLYVSKASNYFDDESLEELVALSARFNAEVSLTGFIFYQANHFIQYLEGQEAIIEALYNRISNDDRHDILIAIRDNQLSEKRFPSWRMHQISKKSLVAIRLEKVLTDYLLMQYNLQHGYVNTAKWEERAWKMVDKIAFFDAKK